MSERRESAASSPLASALAQAQSIVEAAEKRAEELRGDAEKSYREAKEQGYREGFAEGKMEASMQAVRLMQDSAAVADRLAEEAAKLAVAIAGSVIGEQVKVDHRTIKNMAVNAIQEAVIGETMTIRAHPEDRAVLEQNISELRRIATGASIAFESDAALARGGCVVRTDFGEIDASIEVLLDSVKEKLGLANNVG